MQKNNPICAWCNKRRARYAFRIWDKDAATVKRARARLPAWMPKNFTTVVSVPTCIWCKFRNQIAAKVQTTLQIFNKNSGKMT